MWEIIESINSNPYSQTLFDFSSAVILLYLSYLLHSTIRRRKLENLFRRAEVKGYNLFDYINDVFKREIAMEKRKINEYNRQIEFGKISRDIIHDLMNHLNNLNLSIGHEINAIKNQALEDQLKLTIQSSNNLISYINNTKKMMLSNINQNPESATCLILEEINSVVRLLQSNIQRENIEIIVSCPKDLSIPFHPTLIHQMIFNMLNNSIQALKDTDKEDKFIKIFSDKLNKSMVFIDIADNGPGIKDEIKKRLFSEMLTTKKDGTGLGLYSVANIVHHEIEGTIGCESKENIGTLFHIEIPIKRKKIFERLF
jgi:signal transduction histidine kinase